MKKSLLVASLAVVSASVLGMQTDRSRDAASSSMRSISQEASTSSNTRKRAFVENDSQQSKRREVKELTDEEILRRTYPEKLEKIEIYLGQRKQVRNYSLELMKEALVYRCVHPEVLIKDVAKKFNIDYSYLRNYISATNLSNATPRKTKKQIDEILAERREQKSNKRVAKKNNISEKTIWRNVKKRGEESFRKTVDEKAILDCYKSGGTFEDIYKIASTNSFNARTKFAEVIGSEMSYIDKLRLVNRNMDLLTDYREGLLTNQGRIDKYKK